LLLSTSGATPISNDDPLITALEPLNLPLDSHVTVARPGSDQMFLHDVYRLADQPLTVTSPRNWRPGRLMPPAPRRDDFNNIVLKTGVTVSVMAEPRVTDWLDAVWTSHLPPLASPLAESNLRVVRNIWPHGGSDANHHYCLP
jgi:hypothetical protein